MYIARLCLFPSLCNERLGAGMYMDQHTHLNSCPSHNSAEWMCLTLSCNLSDRARCMEPLKYRGASSYSVRNEMIAFLDRNVDIDQACRHHHHLNVTSQLC